MTDEPHLPRFFVRRGTRRGWMVWDRHTKGPAKYQGHAVVDDGEMWIDLTANALFVVGQICQMVFQ